jgi:hypothetical protein
MNKYLLLTLLSLCFFSNCKEENLNTDDKVPALVKEEVEELMLSVTVPLDNRYTVEFILTDTTGKVLTASKSVVGLQDFKIYGPKISDQVINVYRVTKYVREDDKTNRTSIELLANVKKGSEWIQTYPKQPEQGEKSFKLKFKNIPSFSDVHLSTPKSSFNLYSITDTSKLYATNFSYSEGSKLLVVLNKNDQKKFYQSFNIAPLNNIVEIDLGKCDVALPFKGLALPENSNFAFSSIYGKYKNSTVFNLLSSSSSNNEASIRLFYPDNYFEYYISTISALRLNAKTDEPSFFTTTYRGSIPDSFNSLNIKLDKIDTKLYDFNIKLTGDFKYFKLHYANFSARQSADLSKMYIDFYVIAPATIQHFNLPDISKYVKEFNKDDFTLNFLEATNYNSDLSVWNMYTGYNEEKQPSLVQIAYFGFPNKYEIINNTTKLDRFKREILENLPTDNTKFTSDKLLP